MSPLERSMMLYEKGKEKLRGTSNDHSFAYADREDCTFRPQVNKQSEKMVR